MTNIDGMLHTPKGEQLFTEAVHMGKRIVEASPAFRREPWPEAMKIGYLHAMAVFCDELARTLKPKSEEWELTVSVVARVYSDIHPDIEAADSADGEADTAETG